jgi:hypothetical protein
MIKRDELNIHTGLSIYCDIVTDLEEKAIELTKEHVEETLNLVSFATNAYCESATIVKIVSIQEQTSPVKCYLHPVEEQEILGALVIIEHPTFLNIFESYGKSKEQPRVLRAISWLRKGMGEENTVDEFISYWTGLEIIKSIIRREMRSKVKEVPEWGGVESIFSSRLSFKLFEDVKEVRRRLFHGGRKEDTLDNDFIDKMANYLEIIRKGLIYCIGDILKLEEEIVTNVVQNSHKGNIFEPYSVIKVNIENLPDNFIEILQCLPKFEVSKVNKSFSFDDKGKLVSKFNIVHSINNGDHIKTGTNEIEIRGKKDSGIESVNIIDVKLEKGNQENRKQIEKI